MTKKDYVAAARLVRERLDAGQDYDAASTRELCAIIAGTFVQLFAPDNPRFNQDTFLQACGLQEKPAKRKSSRAVD